MRAAALLAAAVLALAAPPSAFRYSRAVGAAPGWSRLELPDDVLDACRPGLPDLRLFDAEGREVPFAFEEKMGASVRRFPIENRESRERIETVFEIDRGAHPGFADAVTFEVAGGDFLKPVRVESSDDRAAWAEAVRGSIFASGGARMTTLRLPRNDRRFLRFRFDDRNGDPVSAEAVLVRSSGGEPSRREVPVPLRDAFDKTDAGARYGGTLPASNLDIAVLRFEARDPAFSRRVRVDERIRFRDEVCRRLIAAGTIARTPGGPESLEVPVAGITGRQLEIEIDGGDSPPLEGLRVTALVRPRVLRFFARVDSGLNLRYGSSEAAAPSYDLATSLAGTLDSAPPLASLGPAAATGVPGTAAAPPAAARVPLAEPEKWTSKRPIRLDGADGVAFLDLYELPRGLADVRIVDGERRQVPFIMESGSHMHREAAAWKDNSEGRLTVIRIPQPVHAAAVEEIELRAESPEYFVRDVRLEQERRDSRGPVAPRLLGTARWERRPEERLAVLRVPIARPDSDGALRITIDNGDNAAVRIAEVWLRRAVVRIDFAYRPGEPLFLYSGNAEALPPSYDLDLVAGRILGAPARAAGLGPALETKETRAPLGRFVWVAVAVTVLVLLIELARALPRRV